MSKTAQEIRAWELVFISDTGVEDSGKLLYTTEKGAQEWARQYEDMCEGVTVIVREA